MTIGAHGAHQLPGLARSVPQGGGRVGGPPSRLDHRSPLDTTGPVSPENHLGVEGAGHEDPYDDCSRDDIPDEDGRVGRPRREVVRDQPADEEGLVRA